MSRRLELHEILCALLESRNVYYQAPNSTQMIYPAIRYSKSDIKGDYANNSLYSRMTRYEIIVIDKKPDNPVIDKLLGLQYCSFDRHYVADNLNHDVLTLYY